MTSLEGKMAVRKGLGKGLDSLILSRNEGDFEKEKKKDAPENVSHETLGGACAPLLYPAETPWRGMRMVRRMASSVSCRWQSAKTPADCIMLKPWVTVLRKSRTSFNIKVGFTRLGAGERRASTYSSVFATVRSWATT